MRAALLLDVLSAVDGFQRAGIVALGVDLIIFGVVDNLKQFLQCRIEIRGDAATCLIIRHDPLRNHGFCRQRKHPAQESYAPALTPQPSRIA